MRYKRAVGKLRILAETCERVKIFWSDTEPFLKAVYAFGEVLDGADPLEAVQVAVAVAVNVPPEEVPWESSPEGTDWRRTAGLSSLAGRGSILTHWIPSGSSMSCSGSRASRTQ